MSWVSTVIVSLHKTATPKNRKKKSSRCFPFYLLFIASVYLPIAGHRYRGRCRRHRHSGILYLSPVPSIPIPDWASYSGTGLVPASEFLFIPVPDWLYAGQSDIPAFKKAAVQIEGSGKWYTMPVHRRLLMVLFLLYDIDKSFVNAGMPEKS